jgi:hypothetical protein
MEKSRVTMIRLRWWLLPTSRAMALKAGLSTYRSKAKKGILSKKFISPIFKGN